MNALKTSHANTNLTLGRQGWLIGIGLFLLAAPLWGPRVAEFKGHNLFITVDSMVLSGLGLLLSLLCSRYFPESAIRWAEQILSGVQSKFFILSCLFLGALALGLYFTNQRILHRFMNSADEHSCYFLAECLRRGKWWVESHPLQEFFKVVHVGNREGKWFSVYPPGWPLLWALGLEWGVADWVNPLMATLSLVFFFKLGKLIYGFGTAWVGVLLAAWSPFFIFTNASYFSHTTCLLMISIFLYSFTKWQQGRFKEQSGIPWAFLGAVALGYGLNTRYLSMGAIAAPFLAWHLLRLVRKETRWNVSDTVFSAVLIGMTACVFIHNYLVTGDFTEPPNHYDKRWERLGFRGDYTILDASVHILARIFYLSDWFPPLFIALFALSVWKKQTGEPLKQLVRFGFFYLVAGYILYYSWGGNQYGPRYYFEGLPLLTLALADGLRLGWKEGSESLKKFLLGIVVFSFGTSVYLFSKHANFFAAATQQRKALYAAAEKTIQRPAIVLIRGFLGDRLVMAQDDAVRNAPWLDAKILYAHDLGERNRLLQTYYPDREFYLGTYERSLRGPKLVKI